MDGASGDRGRWPNGYRAALCVSIDVDCRYGEANARNPDPYGCPLGDRPDRLRPDRDRSPPRPARRHRRRRHLLLGRPRRRGAAGPRPTRRRRRPRGCRPLLGAPALHRHERGRAAGRRRADARDPVTDRRYATGRPQDAGLALRRAHLSALAAAWRDVGDGRAGRRPPLPDAARPRAPAPGPASALVALRRLPVLRRPPRHATASLRVLAGGPAGAARRGQVGCPRGAA